MMDKKMKQAGINASIFAQEFQTNIFIFHTHSFLKFQ